MARNESDREDLFAEALALSPGWEFRRATGESPVVAGFRNSGFLSLYFGSDPVYHFDDQLRVRRAYVGGLLFRSEGETLACIQRVRSEHQTDLVRHDLSSQELREFFANLRQQIQSLATQIESLCDKGPVTLEVLRSRGTDCEKPEQLRTALQQILQSPDQLSPPLR